MEINPFERSFASTPVENSSPVVGHSLPATTTTTTAAPHSDPVHGTRLFSTSPPRPASAGHTNTSPGRVSSSSTGLAAFIKRMSPGRMSPGRMSPGRMSPGRVSPGRPRSHSASHQPPLPPAESVALPVIPPPDVLEKLQRSFDSSPKPSLPGFKHISPSLGLPGELDRLRNWAHLAEKWISPGGSLVPPHLQGTSSPKFPIAVSARAAADSMAMASGVAPPPLSPTLGTATATSQPASPRRQRLAANASSVTADLSSSGSALDAARHWSTPNAIPMPRRPASQFSAAHTSSLMQLASQIPTPTPIYAGLGRNSSSHSNSRTSSPDRSTTPPSAPVPQPRTAPSASNPPFVAVSAASPSFLAAAPPNSAAAAAAAATYLQSDAPAPTDSLTIPGTADAHDRAMSNWAGATGAARPPLLTPGIMSLLTDSPFLPLGTSATNNGTRGATGYQPSQMPLSSLPEESARDLTSPPPPPATHETSYLTGADPMEVDPSITSAEVRQHFHQQYPLATAATSLQQYASISIPGTADRNPHHHPQLPMFSAHVGVENGYGSTGAHLHHLHSQHPNQQQHYGDGSQDVVAAAAAAAAAVSVVAAAASALASTGGTYPGASGSYFGTMSPAAYFVPGSTSSPALHHPSPGSPFMSATANSHPPSSHAYPAMSSTNASYPFAPSPLATATVSSALSNPATMTTAATIDHGSTSTTRAGSPSKPPQEPGAVATAPRTRRTRKTTTVTPSANADADGAGAMATPPRPSGPTDFTQLGTEHVPIIPPQKKGNTKRKVDFDHLDEGRKAYLERNRTGSFSFCMSRLITDSHVKKY
ncbi:hypothetical protein BC828DRAFT_33748 [Blastocladiella britannica]|nr:hypothetical protein BC828DRAFT_33748 [Blastocladiella britannica]